jgi:signal transduction histidine kinase
MDNRDPTTDVGRAVGSRPRARLRDRLRFERLLARLSATFIHLPADQVDAHITRGLRQIVRYLDLDRCSIAEFLPDRGQCLVTHSYVVAGLDPYPRVVADDRLPWFIGELRRGYAVRLCRLPDDLPPEAEQERAYCLREGVKATLAVPLTVGRTLVGLLTMSSFRTYQAWPDDVVRSVRLLGEVFANAVARRRAEEDRQALREQLARVGRATLLGELAASIAHEVNQPLCAIASNAEALRRMTAGDSAEVHEALADIAGDARRAGAVIARIRGFLQKTPPRFARQNVNEVVAEVAALARGFLARHSVALRLDLANGLPTIRGDRVQLQQVVLNLLTNAAEAAEHATGGPSQIIVTSFTDVSAGVGVAVRDSGPGISAEDADRVFEPFVTTKPGSMGMGLAICRSIVTAHGGRVWAAPNPGGGTTVQFTLPADSEEHS